MRDILAAVDADQYICYITGGSNFRKKINPNYKANRTDEPPVHLQACREFLVTEWNSKITENIEADDAMGLAQAPACGSADTVICSLDKDMRTVPGKHYSWQISGINRGTPWVREAEFVDVSVHGALQAFYRQLLVGDVADNLFGVRGIGPKKASKIIDVLETEQQMFDTVRSLYNDDERFLMNAVCFYIMQKDKKYWIDHAVNHLISDDQLRQGAAVLSKSMKSLTEDT